ncbi:hypothetical protein QCA50_009786 [Cerrena zonata]|uniref:Phosphatidylinositol transfer protein SFH5 n=1 Tax=Cerrena zonata TaxID=2478898 RepID=A0AAW0G2M9_9APHY
MSEPTAATTAPTTEPEAVPAPKIEEEHKADAVTEAAPVEIPVESTPAPASEPAPETKEEPAAAPAPTEPEVEEPQNELTKKFTEQEWKALKEFRTELPAIFTEAYHPDEKDAKSEPIQIWGVTLDPAAPAKDAKTSVLLMKFLRARNLNVKDAHTMLVGTLRWRDEFKVNELAKEEFPADIFGKLGYIAGKDKGGRPVIYNLYGASDIKAVFGDVQRFIRWRVQFMEKSIELLDFETIDQMVQVHDYDGVSFLAGRDANQKAAASEATNIFQNHYPEFLSRKFFINVPTVLSWIFWAFKSVLSAATFAKMSVVGHGQSSIKSAFLPLIDIEQIP